MFATEEGFEQELPRSSWIHHVVPAFRPGEGDQERFPEHFHVCRRDVLSRSPAFAVVELHVAAPACDAFRVTEHRGTAEQIQSGIGGSKLHRFPRTFVDAEAVYASIVRELLSPLHRFKPLLLMSPIGGPSSSSSSSSPSLLNRSVASLLGTLYSEAARPLIEKGMWLTRVNPAQVDRAIAVLLKMKDLLESSEDSLSGGASMLEAEFFATLPTDLDGSYGPASRTRRIDTPEALAQWLETCTAMRDVLNVGEAAVDIGGSGADIDLLYSSLGCEIEHLPPGTAEAATVAKLFSKDGSLTVVNVFRVSRRMEFESFADGVGNVQVLFHGSKAGNVFGILTRGMLLPQLVTQKFGVARTNPGNLGAGLYFSDSANSSLRYALPTEAGSRFMLVCDVALGRVHRTRTPMPGLAQAPDGCDSVQAVGGSCEVFPFDEYAVYSVQQQRLRYLVEFSSTERHDAVVVPMASPLKPAEQLGFLDANIPPSSQPKVNPAQPRPGQPPKLGLQSTSGEVVPLEAISVQVKLVDVVAEVTVWQSYFHHGSSPIEAKFIFPLDDNSAICGFEAFINRKRIVGVVKEKQLARQEYEEAVERGDGACEAPFLPRHPPTHPANCATQIFWKKHPLETSSPSPSETSQQTLELSSRSRTSLRRSSRGMPGSSSGLPP